MHNTNMIIGSYGVTGGAALHGFEDECVGNCPQAFEGVVVTRFEDKKVFVRDWHINSHFKGNNVLEQFEEAKNSQNFEFSFSSERAMLNADHLDGSDPVLQQKLLNQWRAEHGGKSNMDKFKLAFRKRFRH